MLVGYTLKLGPRAGFPTVCMYCSAARGPNANPADDGSSESNFGRSFALRTWPTDSGNREY